MALRTRNAAVLAKVETTNGTFVAPSAATDGVLVENPSISFNPQNVTTDEVTGSLDGRGPILGGMNAQVSFAVYLKGTGTAATAPEFGDMLRACGWAETITAAAVPVAAEACAAGGTTTTVNLGTSASAVAQAYRGMPLVLTGTVAAETFITDYTSGKVATVTDTLSGAPGVSTSYQIPPNVLYSPASINIPSLSMEVFMDGVRYRFKGARGTVSFEFTAAGACKATFTFSALYEGKADAAVPTVTYDGTRPGTFRNSHMSIARSLAALQTLSLDAGVELVFPANPNATEGFDPPDIVRRNMSGSMDPYATLVATRDLMAAFRAGTEQIVHARVTGGNASGTGRRVALTIPAAFYTGYAPGDANGLMTEQVQFFPRGQDSGAFLCFW